MNRTAAILLALLIPAAASGGVLLTQERALKLAFPDGKSERRTVYLNEVDRAIVQRAARARVDSLVHTYYVGNLRDGGRGFAFFETNVVRTMPETFMTVIDSSGAVKFVELLAFYEPSDYQPPARWLDQFDGKGLDDQLLVKRGVRNITGATLTARAVNDGVRRALAMWAFIEKKAGEGGAGQ